MRDNTQIPAPIDANAFSQTFAAYLTFEATFDAVPVASDREAAALARFVLSVGRRNGATTREPRSKKPVKYLIILMNSQCMALVSISLLE